MKTFKSLMLTVALAVAVLPLTSRAQTNAPTETNAVPSLGALDSVLALVPTINPNDTNLQATTMELRIGTASAPNPKVTGVFSDAQFQYNLKNNFTFTGDIVSGNMGGVVDDFNAEFGYRKVIGNFALNPFIGGGYSLSGHGVTSNPGLLMEIFPSPSNRLGIYGSIEYDIGITGDNRGKNAGVGKVGADYRF